MELLLLHLNSVEVSEDLFSLTIISNVEDEVDLLFPELLRAVSFALDIYQGFDEFVFFHFSLDNLNVGFGFNNFNWKVLKNIGNVLV